MPVCTKTAKQQLKEIVDFLNENKLNAEGRRLWDVLTALRGPDSNDGNLKRQTTARLRGAIGLQDNLTYFISNEKPEYVNVEAAFKENPYFSFHFGEHFNSALAAVRLFQREDLQQDETQGVEW